MNVCSERQCTQGLFSIVIVLHCNRRLGSKSDAARTYLSMFLVSNVYILAIA